MSKAIVRDAATEMDEMLASVMPGDWFGHARLKIEEAGLTGRKRDVSRKVARKLLERHDGLTAEKAAEAAIQNVEEKMG